MSVHNVTVYDNLLGINVIITIMCTCEIHYAQVSLAGGGPDLYPLLEDSWVQ